MPNKDYTTDLLEIKDLIIDKIEKIDFETHIYFTIKQKPHTCPNCGNVTEQVHDYRTSIIKDIPAFGNKVFLHYKKRRYHCSCCNKHFYETFTQVPKHHRTTTRLAFYSIHLLKNKQSVSSVAKMLGISVSSVFRSLKKVRYPKPKEMPVVLSIDEFRGNAGGEKFQAILTDAKHHKLVDILPKRTQSTLSEYFRSIKNRNTVKYFVMDMNKVYKDLAKTYFPNATIVIDKFHVVRYASWALENVRKRIQKSMPPHKRIYFKRSRRLLLKRKKDLNEENIQALEVMFQQSQDLATAYYLKEQFYDLMKSKSRVEAAKKLQDFMILAYASQIKEFKACLTMLKNWAKYILNAFDCPYTNGYTEGINNAIKVIKRTAFGYRNFDNFRNRIFLALT